MTILLGLLMLGASLAGLVVGILMSTGRPDGSLFVFGVTVGVVGMSGLRLVQGDVGRRLATRQFGRLQTHLLQETLVVTQDRDRLARKLLEGRAGGTGNETPPDHLSTWSGPGRGR